MLQLNGNILTVGSSGVAGMFNFNVAAYANLRTRLVVIRRASTYDVYAAGLLLTKVTTGGYLTLVASPTLTVGGLGAVLNTPIKLYNFMKVNRAITGAEVLGLELDINSLSGEAVFYLKNNKLAADNWRDVMGRATTTVFTGIAVTYPDFIYGGAAGTTTQLLKGLPATIYAVAGKELNIYWENVVQGYANYRAELIIAGTSVRNMNDCLRINYAAAGTYTGNVNLYNYKNELVESKALTIVVKAANTGTGTLQFLCVGDSTIDDALMVSPGVPYYDHEGPQIVRMLYDLSAETLGYTPLMIGHKRNYPPYFHAGMSGWASSNFLDPSSPFWNAGANDFTNYVTTQIATIPGAVNRIDVMIYQIGINDLKTIGTQPATVIANIKTFINQFLADYPDADVVVGMPGSGCDMTGYSNHFYGTGSWVNFTTKMKALQALMITNFDNAAFLPNVYLANAGQCIDRVNGYPYKLETISARVTEQQLQHWDSVHPNEAGYNQMADVYYARVKAII
jgi:lysophospholipase L1-like esterase